MMHMIYKADVIEKLGISGASKKANAKYEANNMKRRMIPLGALMLFIR